MPWFLPSEFRAYGMYAMMIHCMFMDQRVSQNLNL